MALYDRLLGRNDSGAEVANKIPIHQAQALAGEFARGQITISQAQASIESLSGASLSSAEITEVTTLFNTINGSGAAKLARAKEIDDVLLLAESGEIYTTPTSVKTRLGV